MASLRTLARIGCLSAACTACWPISRVGAIEPESASQRPAELSQIEFAGGVVRLAIPSDWNAIETPSGRNLRLVLTPDERVSKSQALTEGIWLAALFRDRPIEVQELAAMLPKRLAASQRQFTIQRTAQQIRFDGYPALRQDFEVSGTPARRGFHILVAAPRAIVEIHAVTPRAESERALDQVEQFVAGIRLGEPPAEASGPSDLEPSAPFVGAWKAHASRLRFSPRGGVDVQFDAAKTYPLDGRGQRGFRQPRLGLSGTYVARDDLLLVTWEDGSRLNYRWRLHDGQLLLTDHLGRVYQLNRLF